MRYIHSLFFSALVLAPLLTFATPTPFAQCLVEKKVTVYGAWWCPYCFLELKAIDPSFSDRQMMKNAPAVAARFPFLKECGSEAPGSLIPNCVPEELNKETGRTKVGVPTNKLADGTLSVGSMNLEELAEWSGCPLPKK